mmetsp:Transcript_28093/g.46519  ORF Transcript_28093/g.46519 Transcript_28093/m.46519 type:complete len:463 (-) Transcript_28093:189-1577(-)
MTSHLPLILLAITLPLCSAWVLPESQQQHRHAAGRRQRAESCSSCSLKTASSIRTTTSSQIEMRPIFGFAADEHDTEAALQGKTIHYRSFHRLTEDSDVMDCKAMSIEERQMAKYDPEQNKVVPYGRKLLILRNGTTTTSNDNNNRELMRFRVHESQRYAIDDHGGSSDDSYAAILYLACEEPTLVLRNKVMELSCGLGLAGLLGTLAVGMLHNNDEGAAQEQLLVKKKNQNVDDLADILPQKSDVELAKSLLPPHMQSLTLTDDQDEALQLATEHLHHIVTPSSEAYFCARAFDWHLHPRFNPVKPSCWYGGIISNAVEFEYPSAKELARTVAHFLEPNGRFLHVCHHRHQHNTQTTNNGGGRYESDELTYLKKFLSEGYLMSLDERCVTVESHICQPQVLAEGEAPGEWILDTLTRKESVALLAAHHAEYDGFNGEYLFPMENGKFDNKNMPTVKENRPW